MSLDEYYMRQALFVAQQAIRHNEVPVGALIVNSDQIIVQTHNLRESTKDPTSHAEIIAIRKAADLLDSWRLENSTLYVTLEPCIMCAGAIIYSRVKRVVFGCTDFKSGAVKSLYKLLEDKRLNHRCEVKEGILATECADLLTTFFKNKRKEKP